MQTCFQSGRRRSRRPVHSRLVRGELIEDLARLESLRSQWDELAAAGREPVRALGLAPPLVASCAAVRCAAAPRLRIRRRRARRDRPVLRRSRSGEIGDVSPPRRRHVDRSRARGTVRPRAGVRRRRSPPCLRGRALLRGSCGWKESPGSPSGRACSGRHGLDLSTRARGTPRPHPSSRLGASRTSSGSTASAGSSGAPSGWGSGGSRRPERRCGSLRRPRPGRPCRHSSRSTTRAGPAGAVLESSTRAWSGCSPTFHGSSRRLSCRSGCSRPMAGW